MIGVHFAGHRPEEAVIPLAGALGIGPLGRGSPADRVRWAELAQEAPRQFRIVPAGSAELVIHPHPYRDSPATRRVAEEAAARGTPCVFFRNDDSTEPAAPPAGVVYRESIIASRMTPRERAMPGLTSDLLGANGATAAPIARGRKPSVGFCGYTSNRFLRTLYRLQFRRQKVLGLTIRHRTLQRLERDSRIESNFIRRESFWAGTIGIRGPQQHEKQAEAREEFVGNILGSLYTVCLRGAGNFSYRLYETLSLGRIPLFVNTDCALPFPDEIDWKSHCVWVERSELHRIADILCAFHDGHSDRELRDIQEANRRLWYEWCRPLAFYRRMAERAVRAP